jgi:SPP1 family predicted phage head-tail adaptor
MYEDIAYLVSEVETTNDLGDTVLTPTDRLVYVNRSSVRQSEFYQAQAVGLRPELMFEMRRSDYQDEPKIKYDGKTYDIIRTYEKNKDFIELIAQGVVNGVR